MAGRPAPGTDGRTGGYDDLLARWLAGGLRLTEAQTSGEPDHRQRGEGTAYYVEVYQYEMAVRQAEGRQLRVLLPKCQATPGRLHAVARRVSIWASEQILADHGLAPRPVVRVVAQRVKVRGSGGCPARTVTPPRPAASG